jgi:hypothetical protein
MAGVVFGGVLPDAERHIGWRLDDPRALLLRSLEMRVNVVDGDVDVLVDAAAWRRKWPTPRAEHNRGFANRQLTVGDCAISSRCAKAFGESERCAKPIHGLGDVLVDDDRNNRSARRRTIYDCHGRPPRRALYHLSKDDPNAITRFRDPSRLGDECVTPQDISPFAELS